MRTRPWLARRAIIRSCQYHDDLGNRRRQHTVVEVQPGSVFRESYSADVDLAEAEPRENNGSDDDAVEPESGVVLAGVGEGFAWHAVVVDKENNLGTEQSQSGPSEETMSPLEGIVELVGHAWVDEDEHHQKEAQNDPRDDDGGKRDLCQMSETLLRSGSRGTYGRQAMDVFMSGHSDEKNQPDSARNTTARVH